MGDAIEELKEIVDLREYYQQHFLQKGDSVRPGGNGDVYVCCPFHNDKTPSLLLHKSKFKCFGCGKSGDVIDMVMELKNELFKDACLEIAENVGYPLQFEPPNPYHEAFKQHKLEQCRRYYSQLQQTPEALSYLMNERRISEDMIRKFVLGFTPKDEYKNRQDVSNIGSRIVFPIFADSRQATVLGMAYRRIVDDGTAKYINDPNQSGTNGQDPNVAGVFTKGDLLYGLYQAAKAIKEQRYIIVVEGYFDVIAMHQAGICNTVGTMGTAMTEKQADLIAKKAKTVLLMMDSDDAGKNGMKHAAKLLVKRGLDVHICSLTKHDPDELCRAENFNGTSVMNNKGLLRPAINMFVEDVVSKYEDVAIREREKALEKSIEYAECLSGNQLKIFNQMIAKRLDMQ